MMHGPGGEDEDDVVEQEGGTPLRLPGWARRPRWLPAPGQRPPRVAAILGIAGLVTGLVVALAAGYALGYRHPGQAVRPATTARAAPTSAASADSYSSGLAIEGLTGLVQTGGACSVQRGSELQLGVEVINLSGAPVTVGRVTPVLPLAGLRAVSQQWTPCGALSQSWQAAGGGTIVFISVPSGEVGAVSGAGATVLPPNGTAWLSVTLQVLVACPSPLPVQFSVSYRQKGRAETTQLPGFLNLAQIKYTGCGRRS